MADEGQKKNCALWRTAARWAVAAAVVSCVSSACKTDGGSPESASSDDQAGDDKAGQEHADQAKASASADEAKSKKAAPTPRERHSYYTRGVHNEVGCKPPEICIAKRKPGQPSDPQFPPYWTSEWTMYRVYGNYEEYPPPYASPPKGLEPGKDYETSYGASYYDSTYVPEDGDGEGAMMEYYEKRCLPIFPGSNEYSCAFISLGNKAYFLNYGQDPEAKPSCCQFSLDNHPPRTDFVKHLPYNEEQSEHLDGTVQAYSIIVKPDILFGYAFDRKPTPSGDPSVPPFRHPQSFFFSGYGDKDTPPNAPIVSQNYKNFRTEKPKPEDTWARVKNYCPPKPEWCCLFPSDCPRKGQAALGASETETTWAEGKP